jgi:hypothetical protein
VLTGAATTAGGVGCGPWLAQAASASCVVTAIAHKIGDTGFGVVVSRRCVMTWLLLEALGAGVLLVLIVWWTMFSGRQGGEPPKDDS